MSLFHSKVTGAVLEDNAGVTLDLRPTDGDVSISNWMLYGNAETMESRHRGTHDGLFEGDDVVQEVTLNLRLPSQSVTHATSARLWDWIRSGRKGVTTLTSVETSGADVKAWKLRLSFNDGTNSGSILLPKIVLKGDFAEGKDGHTIAMSGTNYVAPTVT